MGNYKHGESGQRGKQGTPEYRAWHAMKSRCYEPARKDYANYGGRGVTVSDLWRYDFMAFLAHVGRRPSDRHSLDRFPDKNGNYEPGNVRWATAKEQANNRRQRAGRAHNVLLVDGDKTCKDIAAETGLAASTIYMRYRSGYRGRDLYEVSLAEQKSAKVAVAAKRRFDRMTPRERSELAKRAAEARWNTRPPALEQTP